MTIEVAKNVLNQIKELILNDKSWLESTHEPISQCFDMAIKSLEAWEKVKQDLYKFASDSFDAECAECYRIALRCVEGHLKEVEA